MDAGITPQLIEDITVEILRRALTTIPSDVVDALSRAYEAETENVPKMQLAAILENISVASSKGIPICQDTGTPTFYVNMGEEMEMDLNVFIDAVQKGVARATNEVPMRPNAVHPITNENPGNNIGKLMPYIVFNVLPGAHFIEITAFPRGAGSENMTVLKMLSPSQGMEGVKRAVVEAMASAAGNPCPPGIIGIGLGGDSYLALKLAKRAVMRPIMDSNPDPEIAKLEDELYEAINSLGTGPMGLGGKTSTLAVKVDYAYCHTASLPLAIAFQCWASRHCTARVHSSGTVVYLDYPSDYGSEAIREVNR